MSFASAIWLLGLIPWAGVTLWLLLGRRQRIEVPFISLWRGPITAPRVKPAIARPPISVLLFILGLLLCVLAAARPIFRTQVGPPVTIIVDHSITMSSRLNETRNRISDKIRNAKVNWIDAAGTNIQTTARQRLNDGDPLILVLTDQTIDSQDPRVIVVGPETPVSNCGIVSLAARAKPFPQVMVRIRDERSADKRGPIVLHVDSGGHAVTQTVAAGDVFVDLPSLGPTVSVSLEPDDDLPEDNHAWLAVEAMAPTLVPSNGLPQTLQRMISVYQKHRKIGEKEARIVTTDLSTAVTGVIVASDSASVAPPTALQVEPHPLTGDVNWSMAVSMNGSGTPPAGWTPIVAVGSHAFVAVRENPARQVWVCLNNPRWAATADYVIFWSNVFDWLAGDEMKYRWHAVDESPTRQVGIQNGKAYNAIDLQIPPFKKTEVPDLGKLVEGKLDLTPEVLIAAMLLLAGGIALSGVPG